MTLKERSTYIIDIFHELTDQMLCEIRNMPSNFEGKQIRWFIHDFVNKEISKPTFLDPDYTPYKNWKNNKIKRRTL